MAKIDLDRLERLAGGLAVLFYGLLFLAFITVIMGSGGGGLLLLVLAAAAHVGRVGLEELAAKRRGIGGAPVTSAEDPERVTGLRLKWLPRELRFGARRSGTGGTAALLSAGTAEVRTSFAALVAEIRERPASPDREAAARGGVEYDLPDFEDAPFEDAGFGDVHFEGTDADPALDADVHHLPDSAAESGFLDPAEAIDGQRFLDEPAAAAVPDFGFDEEVAGGVFDGGRDFGGEPEAIDVPDFFIERTEPTEPARRSTSRRAKADAPTAQERYEARQLARRERGEGEPVSVAVEVVEEQAPQRARRRKAGGRPDPLQTRRPTRAR